MILSLPLEKAANVHGIEKMPGGMQQHPGLASARSNDAFVLLMVEACCDLAFAASE